MAFFKWVYGSVHFFFISGVKGRFYLSPFVYPRSRGELLIPIAPGGFASPLRLGYFDQHIQGKGRRKAHRKAKDGLQPKGREGIAKGIFEKQPGENADPDRGADAHSQGFFQRSFYHSYTIIGRIKPSEPPFTISLKTLISRPSTRASRSPFRRNAPADGHGEPHAPDEQGENPHSRTA